MSILDIIKQYQVVIVGAFGAATVHLIQRRKYSEDLKTAQANKAKIEQETVDGTVELWHKIIVKLREDVTELTEEIKILRTQNGDLSKEVNRLTLQNQNLTSEVQKLREEVAKLHNENITLKNKK